MTGALQLDGSVDGVSLRLLGGIKNDGRRERSNSLRSKLRLKGEVLSSCNLVGESWQGANDKVWIPRECGCCHGESCIGLTLDCHGIGGGVDVGRSELQRSAIERKVDWRAIGVDVSSCRYLIGNAVAKHRASELGHTWRDKRVDQAKLTIIRDCIVDAQIGAFDI